MGRQPLLHDLLSALAAPTQAWSDSDGQIRALGAQGIFHGDLRALSRAQLFIDDEEPECIRAGTHGPGRVTTIGLARNIDSPEADPTLRLERHREVQAGAVIEQIVLSSAASSPVRGRVSLKLASDLAPMSRIKDGEPTFSLAATRGESGSLAWSNDDMHVQVDAEAEVNLADPTAPELRWQVELSPGDTCTLSWRLEVADATGVLHGAAAVGSTGRVGVEYADFRLGALINQSLQDLSMLRMSSSFAPEDSFLAAGAPWFFTLFGRDSLWAARMLLPLETNLAAGTLRSLAALQGTTVNPDTAEEPGKIVHEIRRDSQNLGPNTVLPPMYYGTIDATPLWICLLHDAWRWGMDPNEVEALLPNLKAALDWIAKYGDADGDGFLEYIDATGRGLANQGWKDSHDSVQWRDGTLAEGTIALCEVQGYAYEAAVKGAELLDAFGDDGGSQWRAWAAALTDRFRAAFWVSDSDGPYPAIALDGEKRPVDGVASNMGHLLGTGLLTDEEERLIAERMLSPAMRSGFGLRTLSAQSAGYWPLSYHGGSVWPHDTAIVIQAMARAGFSAAARALSHDLLAAAPSLDYRLPELFAGNPADHALGVIPYPAACRPQAWSAGSALVILAAYLGLEADVPRGRLSIAPGPVRDLQVKGLQVAGHQLDITVTDQGKVEVTTTAPVSVHTETQ